MTTLEYLTENTQNRTYEQAIEFLKFDDNFLCGMEIKDSHLDLYLFFAGSNKLTYFVYFNKQLLFSGDDFKPLPQYGIDELESVVCLLSWITLQKGDVDQDYFKNYNELQLRWSKSMYCDNLKLYSNAFLNYSFADPDHIEAKNYFTNWFID